MSGSALSSRWGPRPGMWVAVVLSSAVLLGLGWWTDGRHQEPERRRALLLARLRLLGGALVAGYVLLVLLYPNLFAHPSRLVDAVLDSADYPWFETNLTAGIEMGNPVPWTYLPLWFGAQTPLVILGLALVGLTAAAWLLVRVWRDRSSRSLLALAVGLGLVAVQALALPLVAIVRHSLLYDASRQVLFVVPALAVAAAAGAWLVVRRLGGRRVLTAGFWLVVGVGLVVPTVAHIRLFPYDYTYFNLAAETQPIDGRWMTDYWRTSGREITPSIPAEGPESCVVWGPTLRLWPCGSLYPLQPYWATRGASSHADPLGLGEYWLTAFVRHSAEPPEGCTLVSRVSRPLLTQDMTMSYVARCAAPLTEYPAEGIEVTSGANPYLLWGWYPPADSGAWSDGSPGQIGMLVPAADQGSALRLTLDLRRYVPDGEVRTVTVSVNGAPVATFGFDDSDRVLSVRAEVPADVAARAGGGRLFVTLDAPGAARPSDAGGTDPRVLGVELSSLKVERVAGAVS